jgi:leucyl/phenylalanyl-tRNA---protein transferase
MPAMRIHLDPESLLSAYAQGVFPMADPGGAIHWYSADPRGILPLDHFHISSTLAQTLRQEKFELRINHDFEQVMRGCMANRDEGTWINEELIAAYVRLHKIGFAHSVECWRQGELAGGLYGVTLGGVFFGESMFHRQRDASKVALVHLVRRLRARGYELLDTQMTTPHLRRFGGIEIPAREYLKRLAKALEKECRFTD